MAKKRNKRKKIYKYECTLTGEQFKRTSEAKNPDELVCVNAYYEMNPEEDDRPDVVKMKLGIELEQ